MASQGWSPAAGEPMAPVAARYDLRPLSTGELLDRTFAIYRSRFWLFAGMAAMTAAAQLVLSLVQLGVHHAVRLQGMMAARVERNISGLVLQLLLVPVAAVIYAATVYALGETYLGREVTAAGAVRTAAGRWWRYVVIALWQTWSALWVPLLVVVPAVLLLTVVPGGRSPGMALLAGLLIFFGVFGGGAYGVVAYLRNSLAVPAAVMEGSGIRASMRRSKLLSAGTRGRIFVVLLIAFALYMVAGALDMPVLLLIARAPGEEHVLGQVFVLGIGFVAHTLVSPVATLGLSLVYFDQRVRKEAFDLMVMLGPEPVAGTEAATPAVGESGA